MLTILAFAGSARSEPTDVGRGFVLDRFVESGVRLLHETIQPSDKRIQVRHVPQPPLSVSLVARDWTSAISLFGRGAIPTDHFRPTRSSRMLMGRFSVRVGPVVPFVHVGAGHWRYDPIFLPYYPRREELTVQLGAGFAVQVNKAISFACEFDQLFLDVRRNGTHSFFEPYIVGAFGALNIQY